MSTDKGVSDRSGKEISGDGAENKRELGGNSVGAISHAHLHGGQGGSEQRS